MRAWHGITYPIVCPVCDVEVGPRDLIQHLWDHNISTGVLPVRPRQSQRCPICLKFYRSRNGVPKHLRRLHDAGELQKHVYEVLTERAFDPDNEFSAFEPGVYDAQIQAVTPTQDGSYIVDFKTIGSQSDPNHVRRVIRQKFGPKMAAEWGDKLRPGTKVMLSTCRMSNDDKV